MRASTVGVPAAIPGSLAAGSSLAVDGDGVIAATGGDGTGTGGSSLPSDAAPVSLGTMGGPDMLQNFKDACVRVAVLGQGASGTVYKMVHVPTLTLVACKMIPLYDTNKRHLTAMELKALAFNKAPFVPKLIEGHMLMVPQAPCRFVIAFYDAFISTTDASINFVCEYMDGGSLQDVIDKQQAGIRSEMSLSGIAWQVLKGLEFIHGNHAIHRDIKPSNLLMNQRGEVKITDFGIVKELEATGDGLAETFLGTQMYMSPERTEGHAYSYPSDIWAFGLSMLVIATGSTPAWTESYWKILEYLRDHDVELPVGEFSDSFIDFLRQCLVRDPLKRPSAATLLAHPFLERGRESAERMHAPTSVAKFTTPMSESWRSELKEIAIKVHEVRLLNAIKKKQPSLPLIAPE